MEILRYVVLANALLAVVSSSYYVLLRRETFFSANRLALWLGIAGALFLPLLKIPDWRPERVRTVMHRTARVIVPRVLPDLTSSQPEVTVTFPDEKTYKLFRHSPAKFAWSWPMGLLLFYASVVFALSVRFGIQLFSVRRLIRKSIHESFDDFTLVRNENTTSPFSFFNWVVLNPDYHTPDELEQIFRHERVHVRDWHSFDMLAAELMCIAFWFNPAVYLFRQLIHQTLEFGADSAVLAEGVDARAYQYNLVKVSMASGPSAFTNQFSSPTLRQRVGMINSPRSSSSAWWRYALWIVLMGIMGLACRHEANNETQTLSSNTLPAINPTRAMVLDLEDKGTWYRHHALFRDKLGTAVVESMPVVLHVKGNKLILPDDYKYESAVYINGKEAPIEALQKLSPEFVSELFVMHQWENMANVDTKAKPYQILIQTSPHIIPFDVFRKQFFTLLQAASISEHPLGESFSFTMNQLLEATFFHNKNALVERTKNEHLKVYEEYAKTVAVFINNLPATPADVETVHVREVARLYTKERPYRDWFRADNPSPRFELNIQTAPKRAKRDSSYYVFSPFYSGDF